MQLLTCCFTGPRPKNYPWGNDESRLMIVSQQLEAAVREAVSCGYRHFISGTARTVGYAKQLRRKIILISAEAPMSQVRYIQSCIMETDHCRRP